MTDLETIGMALRRAIYKEADKRLPDQTIIDALSMFYNELQVIHLEREWQFKPWEENEQGQPQQQLQQIPG